MKAVIGILGGMGPRATVSFEQRLLAGLEGGDQDLPAIITVNDGSVPDRSGFLLGRGQDPLPVLLRNALLLERAGADVIAMPCNSACAPRILGRLQPLVGVPIIDLPREVTARAADRGSTVYLLATEGLVATAYYQSLCAAAGISCMTPDKSGQVLAGTVIRAVKANDTALARSAASQLKAKLQAAQCDTVILGCTELPVMAGYLVPSGMTAIDTLDVLADATLAYTNQVKEEPYDARPVYA